MTDEKISDEGSALLKALDDSKAATHDRFAIGFYLAVGAAFRAGRLKDEQILDLFRAGMHAHRLTCIDSFLGLFVDGDGLDVLKANGGVSARTIATIALTTIEQRKAATEKFMTLCEMLEG